MIVKQHNFDIKDVLGVFQPAIDSGTRTVQKTEKALDTVQPMLDFLNQHWVGIVIGTFIAMVIANLIGNSING